MTNRTRFPQCFQALGMIMFRERPSSMRSEAPMLNWNLSISSACLTYGFSLQAESCNALSCRAAALERDSRTPGLLKVWPMNALRGLQKLYKGQLMPPGFSDNSESASRRGANNFVSCSSETDRQRERRRALLSPRFFTQGLCPAGRPDQPIAFNPFTGRDVQRDPDRAWPL